MVKVRIRVLHRQLFDERFDEAGDDHGMDLHGTALSAVVPAGEDAFEFLLVPSLIGDLIFQLHFEAEVAEAVRLSKTPVVVRDGLFLRCQRVVQHLPRDRKSTRLNSSHIQKSRMPSSA